jgi:hypothetical protein
MDTKAHGSKTKGLSVSIRVNPWLNRVFPHPVTKTRADDKPWLRVRERGQAFRSETSARRAVSNLKNSFIEPIPG